MKYSINNTCSFPKILYEWLVFLIKSDFITDGLSGFISEFERVWWTLYLSLAIQDLFKFADCHRLWDGDLSAPFCWSKAMRLYLQDMLASLAKPSFESIFILLYAFSRIGSYCDSSEDFLEQYPSDAVSPEESRYSVPWSDCLPYKERACLLHNARSWPEWNNKRESSLYYYP